MVSARLQIYSNIETAAPLGNFSCLLGRACPSCEEIDIEGSHCAAICRRNQMARATLKCKEPRIYHQCGALSGHISSTCEHSVDSLKSCMRAFFPKGFVTDAWNARVGYSFDKVCTHFLATQDGTRSHLFISNIKCLFARFFLSSFSRGIHLVPIGSRASITSTMISELSTTLYNSCQIRFEVPLRKTSSFHHKSCNFYWKHLPFLPDWI